MCLLKDEGGDLISGCGRKSERESKKGFPAPDPGMVQMLIHMTVCPPQDTQGLLFLPGWAKQVSKWCLPAPVVEHEEKDLGAKEP